MQKILLLISFLFLAAATALIFSAAHTEVKAQASTAPGAGHGFLIDTHLKAGLNCASCHKENPPAAAPDSSLCMSCHGSYEQVAAKTASDDPNPHQSHQGEVPCETCHHIHRVSESFCDQCHAFGMKVP